MLWISQSKNDRDEAAEIGGNVPLTSYIMKEDEEQFLSSDLKTKSYILNPENGDVEYRYGIDDVVYREVFQIKLFLILIMIIFLVQTTSIIWIKLKLQKKNIEIVQAIGIEILGYIIAIILKKSREGIT